MYEHINFLNSVQCFEIHMKGNRSHEVHEPKKKRNLQIVNHICYLMDRR